MRGITFAESARLLSMRESRVLRRVRDAGVLPILRLLSRIHQVGVIALLGRCRRAVLVRARHALWAALTARAWSQAAIARVLEVDRKSIRNALEKRAAQLAPVGTP